jgi:hypothetical protein
MRKNVLITLIVGMSLAISGAASALDLTARINTGAGSQPLVSGDGGATATGALAPGNIIGVEIFVDNAAQDVISAIFATLTWDGTQVAFLGGGFTGPILTGTCTGFSCVAPVLSPGIGAPLLKPLSPFGQATGDTDWLQVFAHTNVDGTNGAGPNQVTVTMGFQILPGVGAGDELAFGMIIEPNSDVVAGAMGGAFLGDINLSGAVINPIPEPGTALLMGLGLMGLGAAGRRK